MKSLQDQLRKAGLVDEQKARQAAAAKRKQQKANRKEKGKKEKAATPSVGSAMRDRNAERDRELNRQKQAEQEKRAVAAQVRQLVTSNEVMPSGDDVSYNFVHAGKVKTIHVDEKLQRQLAAGHLAIVALSESKATRYALVPDVVGRKVAERDPEAVVRQTGEQSGDIASEDDPYAGFEVPDDLMW